MPIFCLNHIYFNGSRTENKKWSENVLPRPDSCARHTFATTVTLTNGVPIETVGQMLGHKSIKSTQLYARVTDTKVKIDMKPLMKKYKGQELRLAKDFD